MLQAGLEGIEKGYELPEPMEQNLYHLSPEERAQRGIEQLPGDPRRGDRDRGQLRARPAHPRRAHLQALHRDQAPGVGRLPRAGHAVGDRPLPGRALMRGRVLAAVAWPRRAGRARERRRGLGRPLLGEPCRPGRRRNHRPRKARRHTCRRELHQDIRRAVRGRGRTTSTSTGPTLPPRTSTARSASATPSRKYGFLTKASSPAG